MTSHCVGLMVPINNTTMEKELPGWLPAGSRCETRKIPRGQGMLTRDTIPAYKAQAMEVAKQLIDAPIEVLAYGFNGKGLGLSTVYGIVKQTGGYITMDSEISKGTIFRIYLPRHTAAEAGVENVETEEPTPAARDVTGQDTILLAEDEDAVRAFALRALTSRGYTVVEADSGESAIELQEASAMISRAARKMRRPL